MATFHVGPVEVAVAENTTQFDGHATRGGIVETGHAHTAVLSTPDGFSGTVAIIEWPSGPVDVRLVDFAQGADSYRRLERAGTMNIDVTDGIWFSLLRALKHTERGYPTLHQVSWGDLDHMLGEDAQELLALHGVATMGRNADINPAASARHANTLAFTTTAGQTHAVMAAYALTRVLPIMHNHGLALPEALD